MRGLSVLFLFLIFLMSCESKNASRNAVLNGKKIFKLNCVLCHGINGKLQANGSKDLSLSTLSKGERIIRVTKGRGVMQPFEKVLTKEEIEAVVSYTMSFKK